MSSESLHENPATLGPEITDQHRAIVSLMEELEAVDWYNQRAKATANSELRAILEHNRDEEKEHAAMVLEWLRRRDATLSEQLKTYLFKEGPIRDTTEETGPSSGISDGCLGIGSLKRMPPQAGGRHRAIS